MAAAPAGAHSPDQVPKNMVAIPGGPYHFQLRFRIRECGWYESDPNAIENFGGSLHQFLNLEGGLLLLPYARDLASVTNVEFAAILKTSGYQPKEGMDFLKHWRHGSPAAEQPDDQRRRPWQYSVENTL
jgi:hypothetical protein